MAKYIRLRNGKAKQKRHKAFLLRLQYILAFSLVFLYVFLWLVHKPFLRISDIAIRGLDTLEVEEITDIAQRYIKGRYFRTIPKDSRIFYSKKLIERDLYNFDARIKNIELNTQKNDLIIQIQEYKPAYLYCNHKCFYVDEKGYVYRNAEGIPQHLYIVLRDGLENEPLRRNYESQFFATIEDLLVFFNERNIEISEVIKVGEVDFDFVTNKGTAIKVDFDESLETLEQYLTIFFESNQELLDLGMLEYIDARFGKKIFYTQRETES